MLQLVFYILDAGIYLGGKYFKCNFIIAIYISSNKVTSYEPYILLGLGQILMKILNQNIYINIFSTLYNDVFQKMLVNRRLKIQCQYFAYLKISKNYLTTFI